MKITILCFIAKFYLLTQAKEISPIQTKISLLVCDKTELYLSILIEWSNFVTVKWVHGKKNLLTSYLKMKSFCLLYKESERSPTSTPRQDFSQKLNIFTFRPGTKAIRSCFPPLIAPSTTQRLELGPAVPSEQLTGDCLGEVDGHVLQRL